MNQGSRAVDQDTEEHCNGRGTGPRHARLVVAAVAQGGSDDQCGSGRRQRLSAWAAVMAGAGGYSDGGSGSQGTGARVAVD